MEGLRVKFRTGLITWEMDLDLFTFDSYHRNFYSVENQVLILYYVKGFQDKVHDTRLVPGYLFNFSVRGGDPP